MDRIAIWTSHSMGNYQRHVGRVIALIPAGISADIPAKFDHLPWDRARVGAVSRNDRYLIVVNEGAGYREKLYAPVKHTVDKGRSRDDGGACCTK